MTKYAQMATSLATHRLDLRARDEGDAESNHELLGEHDGGTAFSVDDVRTRLSEQRILAHDSGIRLLTIRRCSYGVPLGYCGLIVGRCSHDDRETVIGDRGVVVYLVCDTEPT